MHLTTKIEHSYNIAPLPPDNITAAEGLDRVIERIRDRRKARKLSLRKLAGLSGLRFQTIHGLEKGLASPTIRTIRKLERVLGNILECEE